MTIVAEAPVLPTLRDADEPAPLWPVDPDRFEWVGGEPKEKGLGFVSSTVAADVVHALRSFTREHDLGWVAGSDCGYRCFAADSTQLRRPDASFVAYGRLPRENPPLGNVEVAPDLAVEVVSPHDLYSELHTKVREYLAAGVRLVWVIDPQDRSAVAYRPGGVGTFLTEEGLLEGGDVLPGFACRLGDVLLKQT